MQEIFDSIYVSGDILQTFIRLFILVLSFDCLLGFANAIKSLKGSVL